MGINGSWGHFFPCWFALTSFDVIGFVLSCYMLFCYMLLLSLSNMFFVSLRQQGTDGKGGVEELGGVPVGVLLSY